jgi:class 3 adenylate cyclase
MKLSIRTKTVMLLTALTVGPIIGTVQAQIDVNRRPVATTEQLLLAAAVHELAGEPMRPLTEVERDARAVAAVLALAAEGAVGDEAAIQSVRALIGATERLSAVRFEVPAGKVSAVIRWQASAEVVPESTPALRAIADAQGVAYSPDGLVVVPIRRTGQVGGHPQTVGQVGGHPQTPGGSRGPAGYVTVRADLDKVVSLVESIGQRSFQDGSVSMFVATPEGLLVAAHGVPGKKPGDSVKDLPIWGQLDAGQQVSYAVVREFVDGGARMAGAIHPTAETGWVIAAWRPRALALQALVDMERRGYLIGAVAAALAVLIGLVAARGITAPILRLVGQARLIARRSWREVSLGSTRTDEIGDLARSLGDMARDLERGENEAKLRGDLSRFMSKQLVDAIVKGEHPLALGGKRAAVSVVFADVVGFTPLAESRDAEQIVALLNELFSVLTEIVFRHGGTVDKFIGDAIMAVWGAPVAQDDHAVRALAAAEDMMRFLETANEGWQKQYDVEIRLGIGVNSGEALVGNIGSDKRMEYTVIGDVVNVAARLEAIAQPNQVLVAAPTRDLVGDAFALRKLGDRKLTGRKTETGVYELEVG